MIQLSHINKLFSDQKLFEDLSLIVNEGEKIALIGSSGCGKSTLLKYLLGLSFPDSGSVMIDNHEISNISQKQLFNIRLKIGMLFQSAALFDSFTVEENIIFPLVENAQYSNYTIEKKLKNVLALVELENFENKMPYQLSGGQKKRVGLARAIITEPNYLFYDEPTTGLDPVMSKTVEDVIIRLNNSLNITSIVVSHQKSTILRTADKIYMIHENKLLAPESPKNIHVTENRILSNFMKGIN